MALNRPSGHTGFSRWLPAFTVFLTLVVMVSTAVIARAQDRVVQAGEPMVLGLFAYRPKDIIEPKWQPLVAHFNARLPEGLSVELRVLTQVEMQQALARNELDLVFTNPAHYIELRTLDQLSGALATLTRLRAGEKVSELGSAIIRRGDSEGPNNLQEVADYRIAAVGEQFLGGYTAPLMALKEAGVDIHSLDLTLTGGTHDDVIRAVLEHKADVGFIRTGVLEQHLREGRIRPSDLEVIAPLNPHNFPFATSTRLYPEWAFVAHRTLPEEISKKVAAILYQLSPEDPAAATPGISGFTIPADYAPVEEAMMSLRLPPFDSIPEFGWSDIWQRYRVAILASGALLGVVLALLALLTRSNQRQRLLQASTNELAENLQAWNQRFLNLSENVPGFLYQYKMNTDGSSHFPFASAGIADIYGCQPGDVAQTAEKAFKVIAPEDLESVAQSIEQSGQSLTSWRAVYRVNHPDHGQIWVEGNATPARHTDGSTTWHGYIRDVTALRAAQTRLRLSASVFEASQDGILITDPLHRVIEHNSMFTRLTGCPADEIQERALSSLFTTPEQIEDVQQKLNLANRFEVWRGEVLLNTCSEHPLPAEMTLAPVFDDETGLTHHVAVLTDISERKRHQKELEHIAYFDALTGIPNRRMLEEQLAQSVSHARRYKERMAVCMLDLDGFKPINDSWGHKAGDQVLIEIARRLQALIRREDTVARMGGDEFVLILQGSVQGPQVFERILQTLRQPIQLEQGQVQVSGSLGVAFLDPQSPCDGDTLLRVADQAAYRAKSRGRDQFVVADVLNAP